jgi:drug/metabolite transporter (DMT)-like permease
MDKNLLGLVIGGVFPAILYAISGTLQKTVSRAEVGVGPYLVFLGLGVSLVGFICWMIFPKGVYSSAGFGWSGLIGLIWGVGTGAVLWALNSSGVPIAKLVPLYNMNTLFAVLLGLWWYGEANQLHVPSLLGGAILIALGSVLVTRS